MTNQLVNSKSKLFQEKIEKDKKLCYIINQRRRILCFKTDLRAVEMIMKIQESAENYLETILIIKNRKGVVRSIDIVNELEFSKPSVSVAM